MTVLVHSWEYPLLSLAHSAHQHPGDTHHAGLQPYQHLDDPATLAGAYAYCEELTANHSRSFYLASALLPVEKRRAVRALYAFCRVTDDIIDRPTGAAGDSLERWRESALSHTPPSDDPVALAWADARRRYAIPHHYAEQLISGVARDLFQNRYDTFDDLAAYAYGVASTVGLMSMHIIGFADRLAIPYAVKLGVALQVTNILRDVAEDWRNGRVYLPQQELADFGLSEEDLAAGVVTERWRAFMRFQINRNHQLYEEAWPGIGLLKREGRMAIGAAAELYRGILNDIEANDFNVFDRRAYVTNWNKARRLPGIWFRARRAAPDALPALDYADH